MKKASEIKAPVSYVLAKAPNDVNGNPRRVFIIHYVDPVSQKPTTVVADDGYAGENWIAYRNQRGFQTTCICQIDVTPKAYKAMFKYPEVENA